MRKLYITLVTAVLAGSAATAQEAPMAKMETSARPVDLNIGAGLSLPTGGYAGTAGKANMGFALALDGNYYFLANNRLGLSLGLGYQQHSKDTIVDNGAYSFDIKNGYTKLYQEPNPAFRQFGFFIGPVYRLVDNQHWSIDVRLRAGLVNVSNPDYYQAVWAKNPFNGDKYESVIVSSVAYHYETSRFAFIPNIGLGLTYRFTPKLGLNLSADYGRSFGDNGRVGSAGRIMKWNELINNGITFTDKTHNDAKDFASEYVVEQSTTMIQALNFRIGLQYRF